MKNLAWFTLGALSAMTAVKYGDDIRYNAKQTYEKIMDDVENKIEKYN